MKGRKVVVAVLVAVAVFSVAGVALAGPLMGKNGFAMKRGMVGGMMGGFAGLGRAIKQGTEFTPPAEVLGLTDEQIAQIQEIQSRASAEARAIQTELLAKKAELRSLVWQKNPDQSVLRAKYEEIAALNQELFDIAKEAREAFFAVLTPEQQAKYNETPGLGLGPCGKGGKLAEPISPTKSTNTKLTVKGL